MSRFKLSVVIAGVAIAALALTAGMSAAQERPTPAAGGGRPEGGSAPPPAAAAPSPSASGSSVSSSGSGSSATFGGSGSSGGSSGMSSSGGSSYSSSGTSREFRAGGGVNRPGAMIRNEGSVVDAMPWYSRPSYTNPNTGASNERPSNPVIGGGPVTPGNPSGRGGRGNPGGGGNPGGPVDGGRGGRGGGPGGPGGPEGGRGGGHHPGGGYPGSGGGYPIYGGDWDYLWSWGWATSPWYDPFWSSSYGSYYGAYLYQNAPRREPGSLHLKVKPETAKVYVDGYYAGTVDDFNGINERLKLEPGPHTIDIVADGYDPITFEINSIPNQTINYQAEMQRIR